MGVSIAQARKHLAVGGRALDIGCQGGHQLALLADDFDSLVGLDIAPYESMWPQFPYIDFVVHDVDTEPLPFPDEYFRTVIATNVFEHVFDVFGLARELARVLEPGGTCLVAVPNLAFFRNVKSILRGRVPRTGADEFPFQEVSGWDGQHLHYFTHAELAWLLKQVAIDPVAVSVYGRHTRVKKLAPRYLMSTVDIIGRKRG